MTLAAPLPSQSAHPATSPYLRARRRVYHMLGGEGHNDPWVKLVDYALVTLITINCIFSVLESVEDLAIVHGHIFHAFDRFSVTIFSVEYVLRVWTAVEINQSRFRHPFFGRLHFIFTPMAIVDLVAIVPFYLGFFFDVDLRAMRVLRLLRVFKLTRYSQAMGIMVDVLRQEARSLGAMLFVFLVILVFVSSLMYMLEHPRQPHIFSDIPSAMWWAVVTMTTLGYGDMVPATVVGRVLGACTAVIGVGMIAPARRCFGLGFFRTDAPKTRGLSANRRSGDEGRPGRPAQAPKTGGHPRRPRSFSGRGGADSGIQRQRR